MLASGPWLFSVLCIDLVIRPVRRCGSVRVQDALAAVIGLVTACHPAVTALIGAYMDADSSLMLFHAGYTPAGGGDAYGAQPMWKPFRRNERPRHSSSNERTILYSLQALPSPGIRWSAPSFGFVPAEDHRCELDDDRAGQQASH